MDEQILASKLNFIRAVKSKRISTKRKLMEANEAVNRHLLILLPYKAMLGHIEELVAERRKLFTLNSLIDVNGDFMKPASSSMLKQDKEEGRAKSSENVNDSIVNTDIRSQSDGDEEWYLDLPQLVSLKGIIRTTHKI